MDALGSERLSRDLDDRIDDDAVDNVLHNYVALFRRRYQWLLLGVVFGLAAGITWMIVTPAPGSGTHYYKATATLVAETQDSSFEPGRAVPSQPVLPTALQFAQSVEMTNAMAERFDLSPRTIVERLSTDRSKNSSYPALDITALATDPGVAVRLADAAAAAVIAHTGSDAVSASARSQLEDSIRNLQQQQATLDSQIAQNPANRADLERQRSNLEAQIDQLKTNLLATATVKSRPMMSLQQPARAIQINAKGFNYRVDQNLNSQSTLDTGSRQVEDPPTIHETDLSQGWPPPKPLRIPIGLGVGLVLGIALALLAEAWDDRVRHREDVERVTELPVLAEIPLLRAAQSRRGVLVMRDDETGQVAERFRSIRTALQLVIEDAVDGGTTPVVLVTSAGPGEGKTTTTANLAATFAVGGTPTLAIDGDFRRPTLDRRLDPVPDIDSPGGPQSTPVANLSYIAGDFHEQRPELAIEQVEKLIRQWSGSFGLIVVDTPPILTTNDAADLLGVADLVVLVVRARQTRRRQARRVVSQLHRFRADIAGVVVNGTESGGSDYYSYAYRSTTAGDGLRRMREDGRGPGDVRRATPDPASRTESART